MRIAWEALGARARGLTSHLLSVEQLERVERAAGVPDFAQRLRETEYGPLMPQPRDSGVGAVEVALSRRFAGHMTVLARWAGPRGGALGPLWLEQDARSVRSILRGIAGARSTEQRLGDALPTPTLDRRALEHLARSESTGAVLGALAAWGHPFGPVLLEEAGRGHADLFRLESALDRALAAAATDAARPGGRRMRRFVAETIDARNVLAALVLASSETETDSEDLFVEGGDVVSRELFSSAGAAATVARSSELLRMATSGSLFADVLVDPARPRVVAVRIERARIERLEAEWREDPVSPSPVLLFVMRARAEALRLRRALWQVALVGGAAS